MEKGVDFKLKNNDGETPLHRAAYSGNLDIVKYLIEKGADFKLKNNDGETPLAVASEKGRSNIVQYLESKGASRNRRSIGFEELPKEIKVLNSEKIGYNKKNNNQATSGANKSNSWINIITHTVVDTVMGFSMFIFKPAIGIEEPQPSKAIPIQSADVNGTLMLLDVFIRKITGEKYIPSAEKSISTSEARGYALTITSNFEEVLKKIAKKSEYEISKDTLGFHLLNKVFPAVEGAIISGEHWRVPKILYETAKDICPNDDFLNGMEVVIKEMLNNLTDKAQMSNLETKATVRNQTTLLYLCLS